METVTKRLFKILDKSNEENLSPETIEFINNLKSEAESLKKLEEDIVNRAYVCGYDDRDVHRSGKMNYFRYTYDVTYR